MADDRSTSLGSSTPTGTSDWSNEDDFWRSSYSSRPYAKADRDYEFYQGAYRYGTDSARRHQGRQWNDVEHDLRSGWDRYEHRGAHKDSTWENVKDAVRDAWDHVTGKHHHKH